MWVWPYWTEWGLPCALSPLYVNGRVIGEGKPENLAEASVVHATRALRDWTGTDPSSFYKTTHITIYAGIHEIVTAIKKRFKKGQATNAIHYGLGPIR